jgi:hypothetical protein
MQPHPRYATPGGFLPLDAAQPFVGRRADDDAFWDDLFRANWLEEEVMMADMILTIGEDGIVRLEDPAVAAGPPDAEELEWRAIEWKPNDKGLPGRRMPAAYIMKKDPDALRAYLEMRSNLGLSHEEAEWRIERAFDANFRTVLLAEADRGEDRRPDMWIELARGFTVEQIFPVEELGMLKMDGPRQ